MFGRFETYYGKTIRVVPNGFSTLDIARLIAKEKNEKKDDDAFAVLNLRCLIDRFLEWKQKLPRIQPFFAIKCHNDPVLLRLLANLGFGFDCASKAEIEMILNEKLVDTQKIIFANPCKTNSYIKHASQSNVRLMTFDSAEELVKIKELHESPKMILRIAANDKEAQCQLSAKYGSDPMKEAPELLELAFELSIPVVGVSFHVGSGCRDPTAFEIAIKHAKRLFEFGKAIGHNMKILDIGGGFPGFDSEEVTFDKIVNVITPCLDEYFPLEMDISIIAEPGRFFASAPTSIITNVIAAVKVPASRNAVNTVTDEVNYFYYVNDGVYGSFNCILFDHYSPHARALFDDDTDQAEYSSSVWGPTCDSLDLIETNAKLRLLKVGDWIYFENMGAYSLVAASNFNGFVKTQTVHVIDEETWQAIRK
ncbi:hypothetical protein M3Y98_00153500 [Aphelenchoides besseyi]|nr:hypothetical protein M3Y98_00153500 [Aphelenchoides besseyi]KAI6199823.1 hypothetical protein M3Y96_00667900 [Aphelenchoides besseyi]